MGLTKQQAIDLAKKALQDIGHWEFKLEKAHLWEEDPPYDYSHWLVSFNFKENDWNNGEVTPMIIVNDEEKVVTFVSRKKSACLLTYDKEKEKYYHPTLSR